MHMSFDFLANLTVTTVMEANILYSFKPKTHVTNRKHWSFLIKSTGETHYICNGKQYTCNQNNVIIAPSGCSYEYNSIVGGEFAFLNFDALQTYTDFIQIPVKSCQPLIASIQKIDMLRMSKPPDYAILCMIETYSMILYLLKSMRPKYVMSANQKKIQPAVDYLIRNYASRITNEELAAQTDFSSSYFRKLFRDIYGVSPLEYLKEIRMSKAKEMLRSSEGSISEIAAALGYANVYDFSRTFKRETGLSPSAYIRSEH